MVTGGRYGLGSKEFTPGMVAGVLGDLAADQPKPRFTIGITDDVSGISLDYGELDIEPAGTVRAIFYGLGSDGTVGANKNTIKILGGDGPERPGLLRLRLEEIRLRRPSRTSASGRTRSALPILSITHCSWDATRLSCWTAWTSWAGLRPERRSC